jgi:hypothetical protein
MSVFDQNPVEQVLLQLLTAGRGTKGEFAAPHKDGRVLGVLLTASHSGS